MTAHLNINYRVPVLASNFIVLRANMTKVQGRKAWIQGHIETLVSEGENPILLVEASALFIELRQSAVGTENLTAKTMTEASPVQKDFVAE